MLEKSQQRYAVYDLLCCSEACSEDLVAARNSVSTDGYVIFVFIVIPPDSQFLNSEKAGPKFACT